MSCQWNKLQAACHLHSIAANDNSSTQIEAQKELASHNICLIVPENSLCTSWHAVCFLFVFLSSA